MLARVTALLLVLLALAGCGARSDVGALSEHDAGGTLDASSPGPDASVPDAASADAGSPPIGSCVVGWSACHPIHSPIEIAPTRSEGPDLAWSGHELLVVYDVSPGVRVAAVTLDGAIAWTDDVGGVQDARIAYDVEAGAGMVVSDSAVRWLGADGRPVGELVRLPFMGWQLGGDVAETGSGFVVTGGAIAYAGEAPGLYYDRFGRAPGGFSLGLIEETGPRAKPEHDHGDDGRATVIASTTWDGTLGELYVAGDGGPPEPFAPIGDDAGQVIGVAAIGDDLFLLRSREGWTLTLEHRTSDGALVQSFVVGTSGRGASGHLLRLGSDLIVAGQPIGDADAVTVAGLRPGREELVVVPMRVATRSVSHSARLARIPYGFAVAWNQTDDTTIGLVAVVQLFECCLGD